MLKVKVNLLETTFIYYPAGHAVSGDPNIASNTSLRNVLSKGPKYGELKFFNLKHKFKILINSLDDYARQCVKHEKELVDTLSEYISAMGSWVQVRIKNHEWVYDYPCYIDH